MAMCSKQRKWGVDSTRRPFRGDKALIPRGAWLVGTHPTLPKNAGRTYTVTVFDYSDQSGEITWVGTGGYWFRTIEWCWPDQLPKEDDDGSQ